MRGAVGRSGCECSNARGGWACRVWTRPNVRGGMGAKGVDTPQCTGRLGARRARSHIRGLVWVRRVWTPPMHGVVGLAGCEYAPTYAKWCGHAGCEHAPMHGVVWAHRVCPNARGGWARRVLARSQCTGLWAGRVWTRPPHTRVGQVSNNKKKIGLPNLVKQPSHGHKQLLTFYTTKFLCLHLTPCFCNYH